MTAPFFLVLTFILAILDWVGTELRWKRLRFFTKPGTLVALIAWFFFGSLVAALLSGLVASILVMFSEAITAPSPGGRSGRLGGGGSWSTGGGGRSDWSSSSSANGGGGGSFGGGGASGSW